MEMPPRAFPAVDEGEPAVLRRVGFPCVDEG